MVKRILEKHYFLDVVQDGWMEHFINIFIVWILSYCINWLGNATDPDLYYYDHSMYF
mgnify:CR=1 FL=1